ncbi:DNA polymerase delta catalytic subunit-like [Dermacentor variabilis]|uniref:DNA polymerase delta catalytic subunit-like n=1 Tax=Dermacentor variabilis TaxID=34621 RepID=UPI003F5BFCAE
MAEECEPRSNRRCEYPLYPVDIVFHNDRKRGECRVYMFAKQVACPDPCYRQRIVVLEVTGWMPYMYIKVKEGNIGKMVRTIRDCIGKIKRDYVGREIRCDYKIDTSSDLTFIDGYGYHPDDPKERFIKVSLGDPSVYKKFAEIVPYEVYMAQADHVCQFKVDVGLAHPNKLLVLGPDFEYDERTSRFVTSVGNLGTVDNDGKETPVLKAMSIDIKCISQSGSFPKAENEDDQIIQIASVVTTDVLRATHDSDDFRKYAFVVGSCESLDNTKVKHYNKESDMLEGFRRHVVSMDPDVITGYEGRSFHWPYVLERFKRLKLKPSFSRRPDGGEWSHYEYDNKEVVSSHDRILVDMHDVITAEQKLRSYSLDCVVREFIPGEVQLEDVTYEQVKEFHEGTSATRSRITGCCVKRALMPLKLMIKFNTMMSILEISNITGVPMRYVYSRGQQVRVMTLIARKAHARRMLFPTRKESLGKNEQQGFCSDRLDDSNDSDDEEEASAEEPASTRKRKAESGYLNNTGYQGGKVLEPKVGYYKDPVCTLDFASLYPSIIIAMNLCYSTLLLNPKRQIKNMDNKEKQDEGCYEYAQGKRSPVGDEFVPKSVRKGILPTILVDLLSARKQVKKEMAEFKHDPFTLSLLNERQLAIKKCANSVYGFTGAVRYAILPCTEIARSVTAYGRTLMDKTVYYVEKEYTKHEVIYGDTDSVMIIYRHKTVAKAMEMGKKLAKKISSHFPRPIELEFEKVFKPYLLLGKKRYAGAVYSSNPDKHDKVEVKGIEMVRRDCLPYLARVMEACIHEMIVKENIPAAQEKARKAKDDLLAGRVGIAELTLSKKYNKEKYERPPPHWCVVQKKKDRGEKPAIVGDWIPYVICKELETDQEKLQKECEERPHKFLKCKNKGRKRYIRKLAYRAEDPEYVKKDRLPIDYAYYAKTNLETPLKRLFAYVEGREPQTATASPTTD